MRSCLYAGFWYNVGICTGYGNFSRTNPYSPAKDIATSQSCRPVCRLQLVQSSAIALRFLSRQAVCGHSMLLFDRAIERPPLTGVYHEVEAVIPRPLHEQGPVIGGIVAPSDANSHDRQAMRATIDSS